MSGGGGAPARAPADRTNQSADRPARSVTARSREGHGGGGGKGLRFRASGCFGLAAR